MSNSEVSQEDWLIVKELLGREPEGLREVMVRNDQGVPAVVRVASMNRTKPFPNMYWLTDKKICKAIDQIESTGFVKTLENEIIPQDPELQQQLIKDHQNYIDKRWKYFEQEFDLNEISDLYKNALKTKGIGGLMKYTRVRCLHMHFAHYLVDGNAIGHLIDEKFELKKLLQS